MHLGYSVEPIENGYLILIEQPEPEEWDNESPRSKRVAGIDVSPTKTWYAKNRKEMDAILTEHYFARD